MQQVSLKGVNLKILEIDRQYEFLIQNGSLWTS